MPSRGLPNGQGEMEAFTRGGHIGGLSAGEGERWRLEADTVETTSIKRRRIVSGCWPE